jgi:hypothetical protein
LAIGRLAIRRILIEGAEIKSLEMQELTVKRLHAAEVTVSDSLKLPRGRRQSRDLIVKDAAKRQIVQKEVGGGIHVTSIANVRRNPSRRSAHGDVRRLDPPERSDQKHAWVR